MDRSDVTTQREFHSALILGHGGSQVFEKVRLMM